MSHSKGVMTRGGGARKQVDVADRSTADSCGIVRSRTVKHRQTPPDLAIQREREQIVKVF
jgi:hypothetical protein